MGSELVVGWVIGTEDRDLNCLEFEVFGRSEGVFEHY